ncbi:S-adenosyl-L-methionine-dependent methyltransferase [Roridomyces roridus]|uniref:S-adenosyl-L-methionine-dependent methyltransferase n=1 Tax=Roridomyces roridus TaxID=1738132 RepID=A0AAD7FFA3_9AGAR|nr:S-adenosyl-L-methionine-dependent methyltransferase [Roridomyces roridus]
MTICALPDLRQLATLILNSVTTLERISCETNTTIPNLDDAESQSEVFGATPEARNAARVIAAAGLQIANLVRPPREVLFDVIHGSQKAAALRVCLEANAPEMLREAGPKGLHAHKIAAQANIDGDKLARLMRYLASHHIYREVAPDVWVNNRLSAALDTGKAVADLCANPKGKYLNSPAAAFPAMASYVLDSRTKAAAQLWEALSDPATRFSNRVVDSALHRSLGIDVSVWVRNEGPGWEHQRQLFAQSMRGYSDLQPQTAVLSAYPWAELAPGSVVVDVGGGVGSAMLPLAREHHHLRIVIQDHENVVVDGLRMWLSQLPEAVQTQRVSFEGHDFFTPHTIRGVSVFFMRYVLHDWSDEDARKILQNLRTAAEPHTVLILLDHVLPYTVHDDGHEQQQVPGKDAPPPLLQTYGAVNTMGYLKDVLMMINHNGKERKAVELAGLLRSAGWELKHVERVEGTNGFFLPAWAVPV